jgi:8-oxo-dGTP pyrophosphatase MutT (NUDIX family)
MEIPFQIIEKDGYHAIKYKKPGVVVIPYQLDENQLLDKIGVVKETNPFKADGYYTSLIMGSVEPEDKSLLKRAKIETLEEAGFDVNEDERWTFLGELYTDKMVVDPVHCFSVNLTGLEGTSPIGDGSIHEVGIEFLLLPLNEIYKVNDSILQSCFFKLFNNLYKKEITDGIAK